MRSHCWLIVVLLMRLFDNVISASVSNNEGLNDLDASIQNYFPFIEEEGLEQQYNLTSADRSARQLRRVTSTVTTTRITTITKSTTIAIACAKLINITGSCRHRNGRWLEEPEVISFDEDTEKLIDILYTPVISVETTQTPRTRSFQDVEDTSIVIPVIDANQIIASVNQRSDDENGSRQARIFFREFSDFFRRFIPRVSTTTVTVTQEQTKRKVLTFTTTNTIFIQRCTPSPFPYKQCPRRHSTSHHFTTTHHGNPHTMTTHHGNPHTTTTHHGNPHTTTTHPSSSTHRPTQHHD